MECYQQAENTASALGESIYYGNRLTSRSDEGGHTLYYVDGELMDLKRYDSRAEAFGSLLGDAALIEAPAKLFKILTRFFKSGAKNSGLSIGEGVLEKFTKHAFEKGRHDDLGLSVEIMTKKAFNLVGKNFSKLASGDNTMHVVINGVQKTIMANVKNGVVRSINMYPGVTNRVTQGAVIDLGKVTW